MTHIKLRWPVGRSFLILSSLVWASPLGATPSGLNNIPTADVTPAGTVVVQGYSTFGRGRDTSLAAGVKGGWRILEQDIEWGADSHLLPDGAGPLTFNLKVALKPFAQSKETSLGVGVANIALSGSGRDEVGQPAWYAIVSHDFGGFRGHAGYLLQQDNNTFLFGGDFTTVLLDRDLVLRGDLVQVDDRSQWMGSFGFLYAISEKLVLESWASVPFSDGHTAFVMKLNYVFSF